MTAKDSFGNNIGSGGDSLVVEIHNECVLDSGFYCTEVSGARQILSSPIVSSMTDNGDGTYDYSYYVDLDGVVTVFVYQEGSIFATYYDELLFAGNVYTQYISNLSNSIQAAYFIDGSVASASARFTFTFYIPTDGWYYFTGAFNDRGNFTLGKFKILNFYSKLLLFLCLTLLL